VVVVVVRAIPVIMYGMSVYVRIMKYYKNWRIILGKERQYQGYRNGEPLERIMAKSSHHAARILSGVHGWNIEYTIVDLRDFRSTNIIIPTPESSGVIGR